MADTDYTPKFAPFLGMVWQPLSIILTGNELTDMLQAGIGFAVRSQHHRCYATTTDDKG
jgi:hypothetical protein